MENRSGRWVAWLVLIVLLVAAVGFSMREQRLRDGQMGSYQGRAVNDGKLPSNTEQALSTRVSTQRY